MTDDEMETLRKRRGYWLRLARDEAGVDQNSTAHAIGLSTNSGTSVLAWEKGRRSPSADQLHQLASAYAVPVSVFTDPPATDLEWLQLQKAALAARAAEQRNWEAEEANDRADEDGPHERRRRRSA